MPLNSAKNYFLHSVGPYWQIRVTLSTLVVVMIGALAIGRVEAQSSMGLVTPDTAGSPEGSTSNSFIELGDGIRMSKSQAEFPPITRSAMDYFFDKLRAGGHFNPPPLRASQIVPRNTVGIWAGVRTSVVSSVGVITLRFRPTDDARLARAENNTNLPKLAESFDVQLEHKGREFVIRHSLAQDSRTRRGLVVGLDSVKLSPVLTEFVKAYRDAGMYFAWPPVLRESAENAWSLLICPRTPKFVQKRRSEQAQLELHHSPYELREIHFELTATVNARIPPTDRPERISVVLVPSGKLPQAGQNQDEVISLSPNLEVPYRPLSSFEFIKIPPLVGHVQEGMLARIETENPAGYIRRQHHSHVIYVHRFQEPSPVSVIIGDKRVLRDEGSCYVVSEQRSVWNEYDRVVKEK